jgi:hypothetical protein
MTRLEDQLRAAMHAGLDPVEPSPDLFARLESAVADARSRRRFRLRIAAGVAASVLVVSAVVILTTHREEGRLVMDWWVLELITNAALVSIALLLGPFIKRFGKTYAADVFRANPGTGKSFIVLTDFAYYLIFAAYVLFTVSFEHTGDWAATVNAAQLKDEVARIGGIVLIIGVLHGVNLLALPVMGRLLTLNRRLDEDTGPNAGGPLHRRRGSAGRTAAGSVTPVLGAGAWVLRIEPAGGATVVDDPGDES